jgi:hypothetical protein
LIHRNIINSSLPRMDSISFVIFTWPILFTNHIFNVVQR